MNLFCEKDMISKENILKIIYKKKLNPFQASAPRLYPMKTSENIWLPDVLVDIEIVEWMK